MVAFLALFGGLSIHQAAATSLFTFLFTGLLGTWLYQRRGSIDWRIAVPVCAGALIFGYLGAAVDRDDLAGSQAVGGRDASRVTLDQGRPAEHLAAADDVACRSLALAQAESESHHAVGEHVEIVDRVAYDVYARVLRKRAHAPERRHAIELRPGQAGKKARLAQDTRRVNRFFSVFQQFV